MRQKDCKEKTNEPINSVHQTFVGAPAPLLHCLCFMHLSVCQWFHFTFCHSRILFIYLFVRTDKIRWFWSGYWVLFSFQLWASALVADGLCEGCALGVCAVVAPFVGALITFCHLVWRRLFRRKCEYLAQICTWDIWAAALQVISPSWGSPWPTRSPHSAWWRCTWWWQ